MNPSIISASGLVGSLIGALSSLASTWLGQRSQLRAQWQVEAATNPRAWKQRPRYINEEVGRQTRPFVLRAKTAPMGGLV